MNSYRYILDNTTPRKLFVCPQCNKKTFVRFIDIETKEYLPPHVGRCNREQKCTYYYKISEYLKEPKDQEYKRQPAPAIKPTFKSLKPSYIPLEQFKRSRQHYEQNTFVQWLINETNEAEALNAIRLYHVGTSKKWQGATIFWQIDQYGKIRTGKIMLYHNNGHRVKKPYDHIYWVHKSIETEFNLKQCLFGEHLLKLYPEKPICIVESEKTAIKASIYMPSFNWLATGNLGNFKRDTLTPLKGKNIIVYPDAGALQVWQQKAHALKDLATFNISNLLETRATPKQLEEGIDIADILEGSDNYNKFKAAKKFEQTSKHTPPERRTLKQLEQLDQGHQFTTSNKYKPWNLESLETFFNECELPVNVLHIKSIGKILNASLFIKSHFLVINHNNGNPTFKPYYNRLLKLKEVIQETENK